MVATPVVEDEAIVEVWQIIQNNVKQCHYSARIMFFRPAKVWLGPHLITLSPPPMSRAMSCMLKLYQGGLHTSTMGTPNAGCSPFRDITNNVSFGKFWIYFVNFSISLLKNITIWFIVFMTEPQSKVLDEGQRKRDEEQQRREKKGKYMCEYLARKKAEANMVPRQETCIVSKLLSSLP
jgi:hypothetical protein